MFGGKKGGYEPVSSSNGEIKTLIGEGCLFEGNLTLSDSTRIDGHVKGNIKSRGVLVLGESGLVEGDISASEVVIYGRIMGNLEADRVEIKRNSSVEGDITTRTLIVEEGAVYNGRCSMNREEPRLHEETLSE